MNYKERPFEYLKRKKTLEGEKIEFEEAVINNWYLARAFVLDRFNQITIRPGEDAHLHVVVLNDDELMLSIVRQVALSAHFINYDEDNPREENRRRTVITLISRKPDIVNILKQEEFLANLLMYGKYSYLGEVFNQDSYIDVELEIIDQWKEDYEEYKEIEKGNHIEKRFIFGNSAIEVFRNGKSDEEIYTIDTRKAQYANRIYHLGADIDNLPYEDIHSVKRYEMALNVFQHIRMKEPIGKLVDEDSWKKEDYQAEVLTALSNIFCADCFIIRYNSILSSYCDRKKKERHTWEAYYKVLSKSEHSRWVVEKLILGYRPYSLQERLVDESLDANKERKKRYRMALKNNWKSPAHIDICSFSDLRRIDPEAMKYDSFLMLAVPEILKRVGEFDHRNH